MTGARPAQGAATTTGDGLVRGRHKARPLQLAMVWCEAGTRHGHYNWRWFGARPAHGTATTTGDGLVRGTRHGHYNWRWFGSRPAQGTTTTTAGGHNGLPLDLDAPWCFYFSGPCTLARPLQ
ncbi:MAG: hypothetical protein SO442_06995 [Prevotella sp.]|nr:hypothetical protein [Prevotella sp.]